MLGPRQEELLSWLQGRGPCGEPVRFAPKEIIPDLNFGCKQFLYRLLARLQKYGFVERLTMGNAGGAGFVRVVRRLEDRSALYHQRMGG